MSSRKMTFLRQLLSQLILLLVALFVLIPIWALGILAFDGSLQGAPVEFHLLPREFSLEAFKVVWENPSQSLDFPGLLRNSFIVAGGSALISVSFGMSAAYAFARFYFRGRKPGIFLLLMGTLLPPVALMTPLYILLSILGIRASLMGLMIVYTSFAMPYCIWNMRSAFQSVPAEIEEAAFLDGAGALTVFTRIALPLALPAIAVTALIAFILGYTEFAIGWLFVESARDLTLAMALSGLLSTSRAWSNMAAMAILMSIPVVLIFMILRRNLLDGFLLGSVEE